MKRLKCLLIPNFDLTLEAKQHNLFGISKNKYFCPFFSAYNKFLQQLLIKIELTHYLNET